VQLNESMFVNWRLQRKGTRNRSAVGKGGEDRASGRGRCVDANVDTIQKNIFVVNRMVLASSRNKIDVCVCVCVCVRERERNSDTL
jgi:hypothetical protein